MDYDAVSAHFLTPPAEPVAAPAVGTTSARRLRDALETIATQGWWSRPPNTRLAALGLGFVEGYVWGRAASLGDGVPAGVVVAAFGVFEPGMLGSVYEAARSTAPRETVLAARADGASEALATALADADDVARLANLLLDAVLPLDGTARPLFSALRALPLPDSPHGRLWRAAELVREHRGDGHLAACTAAGLRPVEMNVLTELWVGYPLGAYSGTRGYGTDAIDAAVAGLAARGWVADGALTDAGTSARVAIEDATDATQAALVSALGDRLDEVVAQATAHSATLAAAGWFPPDPRKAAAG